jgi:hypothetical protein
VFVIIPVAGIVVTAASLPATGIVVPITILPVAGIVASAFFNTIKISIKIVTQ